MPTNLNFLPKTSLSSSHQFDRVIHWLLTVGRYSVIFAELVVIIAFASRFKFDRQLNDLVEERERQLIILESYADTETQLKLHQAQIKLGKTIVSSQLNSYQFFTALESSLVPNLRLNQINLSSSSAEFTGQALTDLSVAQLATILVSSPQLDSLSLDDFGNSKDGNLGFSFSAVRHQSTNSTDE